MSEVNSTTVFGCYEHVSIPQLGIDDTIAKIDTGAYSGALHCTFVKETVRESDGKKVLRFIPVDNHRHATETENYSVVRVRSSTGHEVRRYLITTEINIQGKNYEITIGLSNRRKMKRQVLIGRRFLRQNNILVDVRINQELDTNRGDIL
ncbi:MAG: ATP-dependent zinc protease [Candidatus Saccharibacteria bacterium]|jgi:hypothetical protein|nr:MAG: ATP-dependent zinc protease [Candidatus Saccharibacteria bacterium]